MDKEKAFRTIVCFVALVTFAVSLFLIAIIADKHNKKINQQQHHVGGIILDGDTVFVNQNLEVVK